MNSQQQQASDFTLSFNKQRMLNHYRKNVLQQCILVFFIRLYRFMHDWFFTHIGEGESLRPTAQRH